MGAREHRVRWKAVHAHERDTRAKTQRNLCIGGVRKVQDDIRSEKNRGVGKADVVGESLQHDIVMSSVGQRVGLPNLHDAARSGLFVRANANRLVALTEISLRSDELAGIFERSGECVAILGVRPANSEE